MACRDLIQEVNGKLEKPEIRVWYHPGGDDYYRTFENMKIALEEMKRNPTAESEPLIAYDGLEMTEKEFKKRYPKIKLL